MRRRVIASLAVIALSMSACGAATHSDEVVAVEAAWLCDLPRFAYAEAADIDAELGRMLEGAGVDSEEYAAFKADLDHSDELRSRVADAYERSCGEV